MFAFNPRRHAELLKLIKERIAQHAREFDTSQPIEAFLDRIHSDAELTKLDTERKRLEDQRDL